MSARARQLLDLVRLERIEDNIWRGQNEARNGAPLFGGQVLAQALAAASATVDASRPCHSLHGYFLRPGKTDTPVIYLVEPIRNGKSFSTRRIVAIQYGEAIFSMDASFHDREPGLAHQLDMLAVHGPETLVDDRTIGASSEDPDQQWAMRERPFEVRSVYQRGTPATKVTSFPSWIRFLEPVTDDQHLHRYLLAYASDMNLVATARQPHRDTVSRSEVRMASLDHAIWFHHDINVNDWLVYIKESPQGGAGRGFNRGAFYTRDGQRVASTIQEGLMRVAQKTADKA